MTSLEEDQESYANGLHLIALNMRSGPQTSLYHSRTATHADRTGLHRLAGQTGKAAHADSTSICHCSMPDSISNACKHKSLSSVFRISSIS